MRFFNFAKTFRKSSVIIDENEEVNHGHRPFILKSLIAGVSMIAGGLILSNNQGVHAEDSVSTERMIQSTDNTTQADSFIVNDATVASTEASEDQPSGIDSNDNQSSLSLSASQSVSLSMSLSMADSVSTSSSQSASTSTSKSMSMSASQSASTSAYESASTSTGESASMSSSMALMTSNTDSATNNSISVSTSISAHQSELSSNNISASQNLTNPTRSNQTRANKRLPKAGVLIGYECQWGLGFVTMAGFGFG